MVALRSKQSEFLLYWKLLLPEFLNCCFLKATKLNKKINQDVALGLHVVQKAHTKRYPNRVVKQR